MSSEEGLKEIRNRKFFLVEGKDDVGFFIKLLNKIGITDFFVWGVEGKGNFNSDLPVIAKLPGFDNLTHLCIIRDKDNDDAFESVVNILRGKMRFTSLPAKNGEVSHGNPNIGIFISPGESIDGTCLEDLCLAIAKGHPAMKCVSDFAQCISRLKSPPKNLSKTKTLSFLAAQPEIVNTISLAAEKDYWDFESPVLDELIKFLELFK
ncbi:MAG: hypothetical protein OEV87_06020 [Phycisphaerae bacterium]|nr:hypothetical protein [Phycisphaerae bacterium]